MEWVDNMDDQFVKISDRPDLAPVVAGWLLKAFGNPSGRTLDEMTAIIAAPCILPEETFVLFEGERPIGTASIARKDLATREDLTPWLAGVYVEPDCRGRGYGTALVRKAEHHVMKASIPTLWLYTWTAERLYQRLDWKRVGVEIDRGRDVVLMRRDIYDVPAGCPLYEAIAWIAYNDELIARRYSRENAGDQNGPKLRWRDVQYPSGSGLPGTEDLRARPWADLKQQHEEWIASGSDLSELDKPIDADFSEKLRTWKLADGRRWLDGRAKLLRALRDGSIQALDGVDAVGSAFWADRTFNSSGVNDLRYSREDLRKFVRAGAACVNVRATADALPIPPVPTVHDEEIPASVARIRSAIGEVYDQRRGDPPNIKKIAPFVQDLLKAEGLCASGNQISEIAGEAEFRPLRRKRGQRRR